MFFYVSVKMLRTLQFKNTHTHIFRYKEIYKKHIIQEIQINKTIHRPPPPAEAFPVPYSWLFLQWEQIKHEGIMGNG